MCHKMLTQRALFCIDSDTKEGMLSQKSVAPPLRLRCPDIMSGGKVIDLSLTFSHFDMTFL